MKIFLLPGVLDTLGLCAAWFAAGFAACWAFGGVAKQFLHPSTGSGCGEPVEPHEHEPRATSTREDRHV